MSGIENGIQAKGRTRSHLTRILHGIGIIATTTTTTTTTNTRKQTTFTTNGRQQDIEKQQEQHLSPAAHNTQNGCR